MSNPRFASHLENLGVDPPTKQSPTTGKTTHAFAKSDANFMRLLHHANPKVRHAVDARLKHKSTINETRLRRFKGVAACTPEAWLAVPILYYGAHPGRFSGLDKLNLQNLGRKSMLRRAIIAPKGYKVVAGDLSQIEARITACLAGQMDLVNLFRYYDNIEAGDRDVYCAKSLRKMRRKDSSLRRESSHSAISRALTNFMRLCSRSALKTFHHRMERRSSLHTGPRTRK